MNDLTNHAPGARRRVVAFVDDSPVAQIVTETATTVARSIDAELDVMWIDECDSVDAAIVRELERDDVVFGVLGGRALASKPEVLGHVAHAGATRSSRSLIVVPPSAKPLSGTGLRFLLPLDGRRRTTDAVVPVVTDLIALIGEVIPVHVFDTATIPMFFTSPEDRAVLADDFAARHLAALHDNDDVGLTTRPRLCVGRPGDEIIAAIDREQPDAVVVCWSQRFDGGRAEVIRRLLADGRIPVVLHPADADGGPPDADRPPGRDSS
jgi:nucleotide-binding universal stress UspA family protein